MFHPSIPNYPKAKFPGVVVFSEIYQGKRSLYLHFVHQQEEESISLVLGSYHRVFSVQSFGPLTLRTPTVTGPVARFARQIAGHGYIVAAPSSYHEFTGPEALAYDGPGTDKGNDWKFEKKLSAYDEDATLSIDHLVGLSTCNGRVGATGRAILLAICRVRRDRS